MHGFMHACLCMWRQVIVFGIKQMIALSLLTMATQVSNLQHTTFQSNELTFLTLYQAK